MATFHIYLFHDKFGEAATRAYVHRNPTINPDSYSPGYVTHTEIQARDYRIAKQRGFEFAPKVYDHMGGIVTRKAVK